MAFVEQFLPHLFWALSSQGPVLWIYLAMLAALTTRIWLTLRLWSMGADRRAAYFARTFTFSEALANVSLLLGVLGTLIGVALAADSKTGEVAATEFMSTFSTAFGVAISTTLTGGLIYIICNMLSSFDEYVTGGQ